MKDIGSRLRAERRRLGMTQMELAGIGGVEKNAQSHYERGERMPRADYLEKIAIAGVDISYVITQPRRDSPSSPSSLTAEFREGNSNRALTADDARRNREYLLKAMHIISQAMSDMLNITPGSGTTSSQNHLPRPSKPSGVSDRVREKFHSEA